MNAKAARASALLQGKGEAVQLAFTTGEERDPATGEITATGSTQTIDGYGYPGRYHVNDVDGRSILASDIRLILEKVSQRPAKNMTTTVDGVGYRVMDVQPIRESGEDIIYIVQLRAN